MTEPLLDDRVEDRIFRLDRRAYTDEAIFEAELATIFEGSWLFVAHESQLPQPGDYVTAWMGRQPVIINRRPGGAIGGVVNACAHRGAKLVSQRQGNARTLVCPYHGWCYDTQGRCTKRKDERSGWRSRPEPDNADLKALACVESYRGFIFASLSPDVPPLEEYLAESKTFIDLLADQSADGLEVVPGYSSYVVDGNWKLQMENGVDGYHVSVVHRNFATTMGRRNDKNSTDEQHRTEVARFSGKVRTGAYDLGQGHSVLWAERGMPQVAPLYEAKGVLKPVVGDVRWEWMCGRGRNLFLFPNLFLMDQSSTQIRILRPLSPDRTEVSVLCIAPVGESRAARKARLAKFRDFFLMSGLATADDSAVLEETQSGTYARNDRWNLYDRGVEFLTPGADEDAKALGIRPVSSSNSFDHEAIYHGQYRKWWELVSAEFDHGQ